jgi:hypothetical protein
MTEMSILLRFQELTHQSPIVVAGQTITTQKNEGCDQTAPTLPYKALPTINSSIEEALKAA